MTCPCGASRALEEASVKIDGTIVRVGSDHEAMIAVCQWAWQPGHHMETHHGHIVLSFAHAAGTTNIRARSWVDAADWCRRVP